MTPEQLADLLSRISSNPITVEMIRSDLAEGAPVNADGTINLVRYVAWLLLNDHGR